MPSFPFVKTASLSFPSHPMIDFVLKPLKGLDLMDLPGLNSFLDTLIKDTVAWLFVEPNVFTLDLDQLMNGTGTTVESAVGVLMVKIYEGKELRNVEALGKSDPYLAVNIGGKVVAKTKTIDNNLNPYWDETFYVLVYSATDAIEFCVFDENIVKDRSLGSYKTTLKELGFDVATMSRQDDLWKPLSLSSKCKGELRFDLAYYPISSTEAPPKTYTSGVMRINIHQSKELDESKSITGQYNPFLELFHNDIKEHVTKIKKRTNNPSWEESTEVFIRDIQTDRLKFIIRDQRDLSAHPEVGTCEISAHDIVDMVKPNSTAIKKDWWALRNAASGKLRLTFRFTPVVLDHVAEPYSKATSYSPSMGVLRLRIIEAENLKNYETVGMSDPYVKCSYGGKARIRTATLKENLNPIWNEVHYLLVKDTSLKGKITFEVFDYNVKTKDTFMGKCEYDLKSLLLETQDEKNSVTNQPQNGDSEKFTWDNKQRHIANNVVKQLSTDGKKQRGNFKFDIGYFPVLPDDAYATKPIFSNATEEEIINSEPTIEDPNVKLLKALKSPTGVLKLSILSISLDDQEKIPSPYVEVLDISGHVFGNNSFEYAEQARVTDQSMQLTGPNLPGLKRRASRDTDRILLNIEQDLQGQKLEGEVSTTRALLHRTQKLKKVASGSFDERVDFFVRNIDRARMLITVKDSGTGSNIVDNVARNAVNVLSLGAVGSKENAAAESNRHTTLGYIDLQNIKSTLKSRIKECQKKSESVNDAFPLPIVKTPGSTEENATSPVRIGSLWVQISYAPIAIDKQLLMVEERQLEEDTGFLTVCLKSASHLPAMDMIGTSDPFCVVKLNNEKLFKSQVIKRNNENPVWNETFTSSIPSRCTSRLVIEIRDWNKIEESKFMGSVTIRGTEWIVNDEKEYEVRLKNEKGDELSDRRGRPSMISFSLRYHAQSTNLSKKNKSGKIKTFTGPYSEVNAVAKFLTVKNWKRGSSKSLLSETTEPSSQESFANALQSAADEKAMVPNPASEEVKESEPSAPTPTVPDSPKYYAGELSVTVLEASKLPFATETFIKIRVPDRTGKKEKTIHKTKSQKQTDHPVWNDTFVFPVKASMGNKDLTLLFSLRESQLLSSHDLCLFQVPVWDVLRVPEGYQHGISPNIVSMSLWLPAVQGSNMGECKLHVKLEWTIESETAIPRQDSITSLSSFRTSGSNLTHKTSLFGREKKMTFVQE